jgi:TIR domain
VLASVLGDELLVFHWDDEWDDETAALASELGQLQGSRPVSVLSISSDMAETFSQRALRPNVIGCVLLLSHRAIASPALSSVVKVSRLSLARRHDFRLFVCLRQMSMDEFRGHAEAVQSLKDLLDTVNLPQQSGPEAWSQVRRSVEDYIDSIPEIRNRMRFERLRDLGSVLVQLSNLLMLAAYTIGFGLLAFDREATLSGQWTRWILFIGGIVAFWSVIVFFSLWSRTRIGLFFRVGLASFPLYLSSSIPTTVLQENWVYVLTGLLTGLILDTLRRQWAAHARRNTRLRPELDAKASPPVGSVSWAVWTTAPLFSSESRVFLSYSRASAWGGDVARSLHHHLKALGIPSFLDVEGIAAGTSRREKLEEALGQATVFISIQDDVTALRLWPSAELEVAARSQAYRGLPAIIVIRHGDLTPANVPSRLLKVIFPQGEFDPSFLRVIDATPETPLYLAHEG